MSEKRESKEVIPQAITQLLERRATLGGWLSRLEELSGTVRTEVYERVRSDYEERLRKQETDLTAHRSEMESSLEDRRTRVVALESDRDERAAELEEAQLRFSVGEYAEAEFQKRKAEHDERLAALDAELEADRSALAQLEEVVGVLANLRSGGSPGAPRSGTSWGTRPTTASAERAPDDVSPSARESRAGDDDLWPDERRSAGPAEDATASHDTAATVEEVDVEEAAEIEDAAEVAEAAEPVAQSEAPQASEPKSHAETEEETARPVEGGDYLDDLEFLESLSLDEIDKLDAVSAMLNEESDGEGRKEGSGSNG